jgi:GNAT superfamily N-acetyltransferase
MDYELIHELTQEQVSQLHQLYQHEWWTKGRTLEDTRRMLAHTDYIVGLCNPATKRLIAFGRVLSDRVFKALIFDIMVESTYRNQGLGAVVINAILQHPELDEVKHFELYCLPELFAFYQKWGFTEKLGELRLMRQADRP